MLWNGIAYKQWIIGLKMASSIKSLISNFQGLETLTERSPSIVQTPLNDWLVRSIYSMMPVVQIIFFLYKTETGINGVWSKQEREKRMREGGKADKESRR